ncbi:MAG: hypothetical protein BWY28_00381 [bacterium ADurb.Bin236]|nr:MAG: hypothetical protein BWY28_00381 [bacterium ADurb.Bin236]HOY61592.1 DUF362 domain-containing protein [bacterium]HPN93960.1 DUF362 domain-containing protein [bacterium]
MDNMTKIKAVDTRARGMDAAVAEMFADFGGAGALLKSSRDVFIKVNAIDFKPNVFTDPELVGAVVRLFKADGARAVYVIENCTQGNFTRLVFEATGMTKMCAREGAVPVFLDETAAAPVNLPNFDYTIDLSELVVEKFIRRRDENLYINIPMLKTHSMSQVTLGVKNQFGLVHQSSRIRDHNWLLHRKLADIYLTVKPDFTLIDGRVAVNRGHYTAERFASECIVPVGLLIGGTDTLAVDVVGARLMGYEADDVEHLRLLKEDGAGCWNIAEMDIEGAELLERRRMSLSHQLLDRFPPGVNIIRGAERCCEEGCRRNPETALEVFANDIGCFHDFAIVMGKGTDAGEVSRIDTPVLVVGDCAIEERAGELRARLGRGKVFTSPGCNNLAATCSALMGLMGINAMMVTRKGAGPVKSLALLAESKLRGSKARVTRIVPPRVKR